MHAAGLRRAAFDTALVNSEGEGKEKGALYLFFERWLVGWLVCLIQADSQIHFRLPHHCAALDENLTMMFLTWNMGNAPPPQDLSEVFGNRKDVTQDMVGAFALQCLFACCRKRGQHKDNSDTHTHQLILASLWLSQIIIGLQECIYTPSDPNEMIQKHRRNKKLVRSVSVCEGYMVIEL